MKKFKVGDIIMHVTNNNTIYKIKYVNNFEYVLSSINSDNEYVFTCELVDEVCSLEPIYALTKQFNKDLQELIK